MWPFGAKTVAFDRPYAWGWIGASHAAAVLGAVVDPQLPQTDWQQVMALGNDLASRCAGSTLPSYGSAILGSGDGADLALALHAAARELKWSPDLAAPMYDHGGALVKVAGPWVVAEDAPAFAVKLDGFRALVGAVHAAARHLGEPYAPQLAATPDETRAAAASVRNPIAFGTLGLGVAAGVGIYYLGGTKR